MKCADARPLLDLLCDSALDAKDSALVLDHIKTCDGCQHEWQQLEDLRGRFQEAKGATQTPSGLMQRISEKVRQEEREEQRKFLQSSNAKISFLAIAASIALVGILLAPWANNSSLSPDARQVTAAANLIDDLAAGKAARPVDDRQALSKQLGYELKYLNLPSWTMQRSSLYKAGSHPSIARFDFVRNTEAGTQSLTCYQAPAGSIKMDSAAAQHFEGKLVQFGHRGAYQFALWSQNGRDYLFITTLPQEALEDIVRGT